MDGGRAARERKFQIPRAAGFIGNGTGKDSPSRPCRGSIGVSAAHDGGKKHLVARQWDVYTMPDIAPSDPTPLHQAIGGALTRWQEVENALYKVFRRVSGCPDEDVASAIFYSPHAFSEKLKCTHNAARFAIKDEVLLADWSKLRKRMNDASQIRNALAHFSLVRVTDVDEHGEVTVSALQLKPNFYDVTESFRDRKPIVQNLDTEAIKHHTEKFTALAGDVKMFEERIPPP